MAAKKASAKLIIHIMYVGTEIPLSMAYGAVYNWWTGLVDWTTDEPIYIHL